MADRCSASIVIGGQLAADQLPALIERIVAEGLSIEFDGPAFRHDDLVNGEQLTLCDHEVPWGDLSRARSLLPHPQTSLQPLERCLCRGVGMRTQHLSRNPDR